MLLSKTHSLFQFSPGRTILREQKLHEINNPVGFSIQGKISFKQEWENEGILPFLFSMYKNDQK
jgi:hypothetical protein